jgi:hypothetical protein
MIFPTTGRSRIAAMILSSPPPQFGHSKLKSTVRYLGIEVDDALEISEQTGI